MKLILFFVFAAIIAFSAATNVAKEDERDVCIAGGGPGGMATAVALKDKGYTSVVLEKLGNVGGNCDTLKFKAPPGKDVDYTEMGVSAYPNTDLLNALGFGEWTIGSKSFVERFLGPNGTKPLSSGGGVSVSINLDTGVLETPVFDPVKFQDALVRWFIYEGNNNWTDIGRYSGPITDDMRMPFDEFALKYDLDPLSLIIRLVGFTSGIASGNYSKTPAMYMMTGMSRAVIASFITAGPQGTFAINGGCQNFYNKIAEYLGAGSIVTNANIVSAKRNQGNGHIKVSGDVNGVPFKYKCKHLVIGFAPALDKLQFMKPDAFETRVLKGFKTHYYFTGAYNLTGPITTNPNGFSISNVDISTRFAAPKGAGISGLGNHLGYGPSVVQVYSPEYITIQQVRDLIQTQLSRIPSSLINGSVPVVPEYPHSNYSAEFTFQAMSNNDLLEEWTCLSGHKETYYVSSANAKVPSSAHAWNEGFYLADTYFPDLPNSRRHAFSDMYLPKVSRTFTESDIIAMAQRITNEIQERLLEGKSIRNK